jgi:hypothetical protein
MFEEGEMRYRTFNVLDDGPAGDLNTGLSRVVGKVTTCVRYWGINDKNTKYTVGFAWCSPKERQSNRSIGQYIARQRMWSKKSRMHIFLQQDDIENPTMKGLTVCIKDLIVSESERKNIRWMKGINTNQIV